jgi:hypothetical protein
MLALDDSEQQRVLHASDAAHPLVDLAAAEREQLIRVDPHTGRLAFRHPLSAAALLDLSSAAERSTAHRRLASAYRDQPEKFVMHMVGSVLGRDEQIGDALEDAAHNCDGTSPEGRTVLSHRST